MHLKLTFGVHPTISSTRPCVSGETTAPGLVDAVAIPCGARRRASSRMKTTTASYKANL